MGGKDGDSRGEWDKWIDAQKAEIARFQQDMLDGGKHLERELRKWTAEDHHPDKSPFERFKGFVDHNFGFFVDGFRNLPSNVSELKARMQAERDARRQEELEIWRRWTGSDDSPDHIRMEIERASAEERQEARSAALTLLREAYERNKSVPADRIAALYSDDERTLGDLDRFAAPMLSFGGACYYKPETVENLPSTARWGWPSPRQRWLSVDWFKRDPYSPVRLEACPQLGPSDSKWRAAFEDLLCAALDKPVGSEEKTGQRQPHGKPQSTYYGPGLEWMLSLQCRGVLPPQIPSLYRRHGMGINRRFSSSQAVDGGFGEDPERFEQLIAQSPRLYHDFEQLIDEVATKAGPDMEAHPLRFQQQPAWRVADTEQELYDSMPPTTAAVTGPASEMPWLPFLTGNLEDEDEDEDEGERRHDRRRPHDEPEQTSEQEHQQPQKPEILSHLTTTQTTRLPDGTVTTKVVLKQRFADGREESHESVHTTHEQRQQDDSRSRSRRTPATVDGTRKASTEHTRQQQDEDKKEKGWFWT